MKQKLMLFQEIKGLDAGPEDTYGVLDANTLGMIVNPNDWPNGNQKQIKKLLGYQPPFVHGYTGVFFVVLKRIIGDTLPRESPIPGIDLSAA